MIRSTTIREKLERRCWWYFAKFSPRSGRPEFTADADVRAVREKYRLRPLFRSIVPDEWLHVRRRDKRFPRREKERNKRMEEGGYDAPAAGRRREKAPRKRDNGSEGPWEREKEKWDARYIKERVSGGEQASKGWKRKRRISLCGGVAALREGKNVWLLRVTHGFLHANNNIYETHRCAPRARYLSSCW